MTSREHTASPVDPIKKQTFLMIMHTAIAAKSAGDPDVAAMRMNMAIGTSECIPEEMSAGQAANEYTYHLFNRDGDEVPPKWTGLMSRAEFEAKRGPNEMLIGEDWHIENPRWLGLPGETVQYLDMPSFIRDQDTATFYEIFGAIAGASRKELAEMLRNAEDIKGMVRRGSTPDGPVWHATGALIASRPDPSKVAESARLGSFPMARTKGDNHELSLSEVPPQARAKPERRKRDWAAEPDAQVLLSALRKVTEATARELGRELPHLDQPAVLRLLQRLRDAGQIQVLGDRRNAVWQLASKNRSAKAKPKRPVVGRKSPRAAKLEGSASGTPRPRTAVKLLSEEEMARVEHFVTENPGRKIGEIAEGLKWESLNRLRNLTEKLYGERRLYRRQGRHYPGKDPAWER